MRGTALEDIRTHEKLQYLHHFHSLLNLLHYRMQEQMIFLINKTLEDFISNDNCSHILMLRPDLAIKLKEIKLILEDLCHINEYQNQFLCDTEYTCMRVKLGGIGDRLIGLNKKSAQKIHQQINQCNPCSTVAIVYSSICNS